MVFLLHDLTHQPEWHVCIGPLKKKAPREPFKSVNKEVKFLPFWKWVLTSTYLAKFVSLLNILLNVPIKIRVSHHLNCIIGFLRVIQVPGSISIYAIRWIDRITNANTDRGWIEPHWHGSKWGYLGFHSSWCDLVRERNVRNRSFCGQPFVQRVT